MTLYIFESSAYKYISELGSSGWIGDRNVSVLRDTGCSTVVIRRSLVDDNQLTKAEETCILIDGTVRKTPVAEVEVNTPYYQRKVRAVCLCMRDPLYDVIIGEYFRS